MDETRALLDALMGPNRNKKEVASAGMPDFSDRTVCKNFLVGFCPHDWFSMPKRQLMPCLKIHSELMRDKFDRHPEVEKFRAWYEEDFLNYLQPIARDCDAYIVRERAKCRPKSMGGKVRLSTDVKERGDDVEPCKEELDLVKSKYTSEFQGEDICEVCGVKYPLGGGGAEWHDKESHKKGKTHTGYAKIREKIEQLLAKRKDWEKYRSARRREYETQLKKEREEQEKEKEKEVQKQRERAREKEREKERERDEMRERERAKEKAVEREREKEKARAEKAAKERSRGTKGRDRSSERGSRSRKRSNKGAKSGKSDRSSERSRSRRRRRESSSSEDSQNGRKRAKSDDSPDHGQSTGNKKHRVASAGEAKGKAAEGKTTEPSSDESQDGINVAEEDIPEFWGRIEKLKGHARNQEVAALSSKTKGRLERFLVAGKAKGKAAESKAKEPSSDEDSQDGVNFPEEDIPEFWGRIEKLKGSVRNKEVAALSSKTKGRLERFLIAGKAKGKAAESNAAGPSSDEESQDGINVAVEDIPEFWGRIEKLKGSVRNKEVAALSSKAKKRLERFLLAKKAAT